MVRCEMLFQSLTHLLATGIIKMYSIFLIVCAMALSLTCLANCNDESHRFQLKTDEIFDAYTKLNWALCSYGQVVSASGICEGDAVTVNYKQAQEIVTPLQTSWRLPTKDELKSLVDVTCGVPSINPIFSNTAPYWYWADDYLSSEDIGFVSFETGVLAWGLNEHFKFNLRLVKTVEGISK